MEVKQWTYEDFPEFTEPVEGAHVIETTGNEKDTIILNDVEYCRMEGTVLHLQILIPNSRNRSIFPYLIPGGEDIPGRPAYPCIVFVRGSAWGKQMLYASLGDYAKLAERGAVVAEVEYRDSSIAPFPAPVVDARNAVRFLKKNAKKFMIDPDRMIIMGDSSGGHTALYAGIYHNDGTAGNLFPGISGEVAGIISQYASSDFLFEDSNPMTENHNLPDSPEGLEMGGANLREHPELARQLTVRTNINPDTRIAPTLLLHGTKDRTVNCRCSVLLYERLRECGKDTALYLLKGADHGGAEFWTPEVLDIEEQFVRRCIGE